MLSVHALLFLVLCAVSGPRACAAQSTPTPGPTPVAELACSNGTDARSDQRTACPNVLFIAHAPSKFLSYTIEMYNALESYVAATLVAEGIICIPGLHGTTRVTMINTLPADLSVYTQIVRPCKHYPCILLLSSRSAIHSFSLLLARSVAHHSSLSLSFSLARSRSRLSTSGRLILTLAPP